jgi:hypothetical protein
VKAQSVMQDRCTICVEHTIGTKIVLNAPNDEDINTNDASTSTPVPIAGPLTRAHACKLNHQVSSLLSSCPSCLDLGDACTLVLIRNQGEDRKGKGLT